MGDVWVRAGLVAMAFAGAALVIVLSGYRQRRAPRTLSATGLAEGVYLLTSETCADCGPVRTQLATALGTGGYVEFSWEGEPEVFEVLGVTAVPATLIVDENGSGTLWPGEADRALATLGA